MLYSCLRASYERASFDPLSAQATETAVGSVTALKTQVITSSTCTFITLLELLDTYTKYKVDSHGHGDILASPICAVMLTQLSISGTASNSLTPALIVLRDERFACHRSPWFAGLLCQMGDLGSSVASPFQDLGEYLSASITGGLDNLKSGTQGAMEEAQAQLGQSVTENIGNPLEVL